VTVKLFRKAIKPGTDAWCFEATKGLTQEFRHAQAIKRIYFAEQFKGFSHSVRSLPLASIYL
jgi:hypothetical protein